jgi:hypothetical protein
MSISTTPELVVYLLGQEAYSVGDTALFMPQKFQLARQVGERFHTGRPGDSPAVA